VLLATHIAAGGLAMVFGTMFYLLCSVRGRIQA
jgi:hypothetical protein